MSHGVKSIDIKRFQISIEGYINDSDLPAEVKRLVLVEILQKISAQADAEIQAEIQEVNNG